MMMTCEEGAEMSRLHKAQEDTVKAFDQQWWLECRTKYGSGNIAAKERRTRDACSLSADVSKGLQIVKSTWTKATNLQDTSQNAATASSATLSTASRGTKFIWGRIWVTLAVARPNCLVPGEIPNTELELEQTLPKDP